MIILEEEGQSMSSATSTLLKRCTATAGNLENMKASWSAATTEVSIDLANHLGGWFHGIWVGYSDQKQHDIQEFCWDKCQQWSDLKTKFSEKLKPDQYEVLSEVISSLIPLYNFGFKTIDYVTISKHWWKINKILTENGNDKLSLDVWVEAIRIANRLPINLKTSIDLLFSILKKNKKYWNGSKEINQLAKSVVEDTLASSEINVRFKFWNSMFSAILIILLDIFLWSLLNFLHFRNLEHKSSLIKKRRTITLNY